MSQQQRRSGSRTRTFPNRSRSTVVLRLAAGLRLQSPSPAQWLRDEPSPAPRSDFAASEADAFPRRSFGNEPDDASVVASRTDNSGRLVDALTARFPCHGAHCEASSGELWTSGPKRQISVAGSCVAQRVMRRTRGFGDNVMPPHSGRLTLFGRPDVFSRGHSGFGFVKSWLARVSASSYRCSRRSADSRRDASSNGTSGCSR